MVWFDNVISNLSISLISFTVTNKKICSFEDSYIAMVLVKNLFKTMYRWYTQCVQCEKRKVFFFILFFLNSCVYQLCGNAFNTIYLSLTLQKCKKETWGGDGTTLNALIIDSIVILNVLNICISQFCENFMKKRH